VDVFHRYSCSCTNTTVVLMANETKMNYQIVYRKEIVCEKSNTSEITMTSI
jgi:hypothetical protein